MSHIIISSGKLRLGKEREKKDETLLFVLNVSKGGFLGFFCLIWGWLFCFVSGFGLGFFVCFVCSLFFQGRHHETQYSNYPEKTNYNSSSK